MKNILLWTIAILGMLTGILVMPGSPLQAILGWVMVISSNFLVYELIYGEENNKKDS